MVKAAKATAILGTKVTAIKQDSKSGQFSLKVDSVDDSSTASFRSNGYGEVIVATPFQFSDISLPSDDIKIDEIPYVQLHVTLFASPHLLSPAFFNLPPDKPAPRVILTTLPKDEDPRKGPEGVGSPGFFSISLLHPVTNPHTNGEEYVYKIFSAEAPNTTFLSHLLGVKFEGELEQPRISDKDITWIYRKLWNSYPYEYPRVTFEKIKLGEGLWYTSGMDSFISTMETNALMGKNVARLIVDKWIRSEKAEWYGDLTRMHEL
jgi:prenylcysteine oxidase/farnesylcysteine lyase